MQASCLFLALVGVLCVHSQAAHTLRLEPLARDALVDRPNDNQTTTTTTTTRAPIEDDDEGDAREWAELIRHHLHTTGRRSEPEPSARETPPTTTTLPHDHIIIRPSVQLDSHDYVISDVEYEAHLRRLEQEARSSLASDPANYVADDVSLGDILRRIEQIDGDAIAETTAPIIIDSERQDRSLVDLISSQPQSHSAGIELVHEGQVISASSDVQLQDVPSQSRTHLDDCPICLEPIRRRSAHRTPCNHVFHRMCIDEWMATVSLHVLQLCTT